MSLPDRNNPYDFQAYTDWRDRVDYYRDDEFLQKLLKVYAGDDFDQADKAANAVSAKASNRWRRMAEEAARPDNHPSIVHFDAHNRRIDRLIRSRDTETMEREVFGEAIFSEQTTAWEKLIKLFLIYQNGEASISCPLACTDGLVNLLDTFAEGPEQERIRDHLKSGIDGDYAIGAQYISEIQGGSDVPANLLEAVESDEGWRLYGKKFFCSATHADYSVVTAKPQASEKIAIFVVPSWMPGDKARELRNGYRIDRIKRKMGTCELITAEISYEGAIAYAVGPLDQGLANLVSIVLGASRLTIGIFSAAIMTRAVREASRYAELRTAFGQPIGQFQMLAGQLAAMQLAARRTTAGVFRHYRQMLALETLAEGDSDEARKSNFEVRELTMLQKIVTANDSVELLRSAMSVFGGHGVIEDFSSLPRLLRDAMVNELWEGPKNVLLTQVHRDLAKASSWYPANEFVSRLLQGADATIVEGIAREFNDLVAFPDLNRPDDETIEVCRRWETCCESLFHAYQDLALDEVGHAG